MHPAFHYPSPLGGSNGGHRQALTQASGGPSQASHLAHQGAIAQAQLAQAYAAAYFPKPEPIENAGVRAGEIIGHRAWILRRDGLLQSMAANYVWQPGPMEPATDLLSGGFHAFKSEDEALRTYYSFHIHVSWPLIFGTVALWGEVIEHERGYRAEYAAVHSLDSLYENPPRRSDDLDIARKRYGVAVI